MSVLDNAKSHFESLETKAIEVEEWSTVIYATPFTMGEKKKLWKHAKEDDIEFTVRTLILKALNKDGSKMFSIEDKITLMNHVDPKSRQLQPRMAVRAPAAAAAAGLWLLEWWWQSRLSW